MVHAPRGLLLALIAAAAPHAAHAQTLQGRVLDRATQQPVADAEVTLVDAQGEAAGIDLRVLLDQLRRDQRALRAADDEDRVDVRLDRLDVGDQIVEVGLRLLDLLRPNLPGLIWLAVLNASGAVAALALPWIAGDVLGNVVEGRGAIDRQTLLALFARSTIRTTSDMMRLSSKSFGV